MSDDHSSSVRGARLNKGREGQGAAALCMLCQRENGGIPVFSLHTHTQTLSLSHTQLIYEK